MYVVTDSVFDKMVWGDESGADCEAITTLDPDTGDAYSTFRSSYWPSKYKRNCTVSVRTLMNSINKRFTYDVILHEVVGHGILQLNHEDTNNTLMVDGLKYKSTKEEDLVEYLNILLREVTHFRIHTGVIPV